MIIIISSSKVGCHSLCICLELTVTYYYLVSDKKMLYICLLFLIGYASCQLNSLCPYTVRGSYFKRSTILTTIGLPTNLIFDEKTKTLLFTLIDIESLEDDEVQTKMDQYILKDNKLTKIDEVRGQSASIAIDHIDEKIYLGTDKGLYFLNETMEPNYLALKEHDIVQIYKQPYSKYIYAVFYPENDVYKIDIENYEREKVKNIPSAFILVVDKSDNIYFECDSKYIKVLLKGFQEPIEYVGIPKGSVRALTNFNDIIFMAANDGIYELTPRSVIPEKVLDLDFVPSGLVADEQYNVYISTTGMIYKYTKC